VLELLAQGKKFDFNDVAARPLLCSCLLASPLLLFCASLFWMLHSVVNLCPRENWHAGFQAGSEALAAVSSKSTTVIPCYSKIKGFVGNAAKGAFWNPFYAIEALKVTPISSKIAVATTAGIIIAVLRSICKL